MRNIPNEDKMRLGLAVTMSGIILFALFMQVPRAQSPTNRAARVSATNEKADAPAAPKPPTAAAKPTVPPQPRRAGIYMLRPVAKSGMSGTVTVRELANNKTRVELIVIGGSQNAALPAALYAGDCAKQSAEPQYALSPVVKGKSVTDLNVSANAIIGGDAQALKVKLSGTNGNLPFGACADLK